MVKRKSSRKTGKLLPLLSMLIMPVAVNLVIIGLSLEYINRLRKCRCFLQENPDNMRNLTHMVNMEYYFMGALGLSALYLVLASVFKVRMPLLTAIIGLVFLAARLMQLYFLYLTYGVIMDTHKDCECSNQNLRYLLYTQAVLIVLALIA